MNKKSKENNLHINVEQNVLSADVFRLIIKFAVIKREYLVWKYKNITYIKCCDCRFSFTKSEVIYYKKTYWTKLFRTHLNAFRKEYKHAIKAYENALA